MLNVGSELITWQVKNLPHLVIELMCVFDPARAPRYIVNQEEQVLA